MLGFNAQHRGQTARGQTGNDAGGKRRIADDADARDFKGKHRRRDRCSEEGGKTGAHAAHRDQLHLPLVQTKELSDPGGDTPAHLESRALASG